MNKTAVVITTINPPTKAVQVWAELFPGRTYVVLDRKTPLPYALDCHQVSLVSGNFADAIGENRYQRKMLGYLVAANDGAEVIIDTDDDNRPLAFALPLAQLPNSLPTVSEPGWMNPLPYFLADKQRGLIWPRGLPLSAIRNQGGNPWPVKLVNVGVSQYLAQNDPDVDTIWRQIDGKPVTFRNACPVALAAGSLSPLNSQASVWTRECFPLLYLPCTVNMRVCDILRGYIAQPILWAAGYQVQLCGPLTKQERNKHDLRNDVEDELPLYRGLAEEVIPIVTEKVQRGTTMKQNLFNAYLALINAGIVNSRELETLAMWLEAIQ